MKIRYGLALSLAFGLGLGACAGGGASSGGSAPAPTQGAGGEFLAQGERPRQNEETRTAQRALDEAEGAADAEAQTLYQQALTAAEAAIAADPTNPLPQLQAGQAAIGLRRFEDADRFLTRAEELRPIYQFDIQPLRERAWIGLYQEAAPLVNSGDYEAAAEIFEDANAIFDERPEVMITLGQIYAQLRRHDEALENYDRALAVINSDAANEMDSATVAAWRESAADIPMSRAGILADAGRFEEAVEVFQELVAANPGDIGLKRNLAGILVQVGRNDEAFQVYDELMSQPGLTSADFYSIGVGFYQGSDYARAAQAFAGAAERSVNDRDAIEMWARSLQIDSMWTEVPVPAERWMELDPNNQNAYLILAQAVNQTGDSQRASELVQAIEAMDVGVNDLQLSRSPNGGAVVNGSLINKNLDPGTMVRLRFTFYDAQGNPIGSQDKEVAVGDAGMAEVFQVDFQSAQRVEGYGYTIM